MRFHHLFAHALVFRSVRFWNFGGVVRWGHLVIVHGELEDIDFHDLPHVVVVPGVFIFTPEDRKSVWLPEGWTPLLGDVLRRLEQAGFDICLIDEAASIVEWRNHEQTRSAYC